MFVIIIGDFNSCSFWFSKRVQEHSVNANIILFQSLVVLELVPTPGFKPWSCLFGGYILVFNRNELISTQLQVEWNAKDGTEFKVVIFRINILITKYWIKEGHRYLLLWKILFLFIRDIRSLLEVRKAEEHLMFVF